MRIRYIGTDKRTRVAEASRVKFISDAVRPADKQTEFDDERLEGPTLVAHLYRSKGGKRLTLQVPPGFDTEAAKTHLLEKGWLDLSACPLMMENLY